MQLTVNFFSSVRLKMKSVSILVLVSFAITVASNDFSISDYGPKNATISIKQGETLKLFCEPNDGWFKCKFTHENNGKSCKIFSDEDASECENGIGKMYITDTSCIIEVKNLKKEDDGKWTCEITDANSKSDTHEFVVAVQDKSRGTNFDKPTPTTTNPINEPDSATRPTEFMTFSILAFTILIVL